MSDQARIVRRDGILARLNNSRDQRYTLIVAPAGSGKSTVLTQWRAELKTAGVATAYLRLDGNDKDATNFLFHLIEELHALTDAAPLKGDVPSLRPVGLTSLLLRTVCRLETPTYLFLDDFHLAANDTNAATLAKLIHASDDSPLSVVVASRADPGIPVSTLQVDGQFTEITATDLNFTDDEAIQLFGLAGAQVEPRQCARFSAKVKGWAVALRLASMLLREGVLSETSLLDFSGTQRDMARYLAEQVFEALPENVRLLLMQTSTLTNIRYDYLADCFGDDAAKSIFATKTLMSLPLDAIPADGQSFRLHAVFADFLQSRAITAGIDLAGTQETAARWYASRQQWREAISYALATKRLDLAAEFCELAGGWRLAYIGQTGLLSQLGHLAELPVKQYRFYPRSILGVAVAAAKAGDLTQASYIFDQLIANCDRGDPRLETELRLISALLALYRDEYISKEAVAKLEADIAAPIDVEPAQLALTQNMLSFHHLEHSEFRRTIEFGRLSKQGFEQVRCYFGALHLPLHIAQAEFLCGEMDAALATLHSAAAECERFVGSEGDLTAMARIFIAEIDIEQGQFETAETVLQAAIPQLAHKDCWYDVLAAAVLASVRLLLIRQDFEGAETLLNEARRIAQTRGYQRLSRLVAYERLRTIVRMGDADGARHFAEINDLGLPTAHDGDLNDVNRNLRGAVPATIWARILQLEGQANEALPLIEKILAQTEKISNVPRIIRLTLLQARLLLSLERTQDANTVLERLILGQPVERYRVAFFEDGATIPDVLAQRQGELGENSILARKIRQVLELTTTPTTNAKIIPKSEHRSPLTRQEIRLLSHLDHGKSNKEIAMAMSIRENTVKFHLRNIYDKLEVHTRTAAVFSARTAGML